ncbi:hypothetical protein [Sphingomonas bacterium]|uniref:hypothetical protein n=1 Tax=Sphingomonas bacterium TaxID=1895847 RepID=UPI00157693A8|nr:hypothetical protein [Sphingomonas bacterium]
MMIVDTLVGIFVNAVVFPVLLWAAGLKPPPHLQGPDGAIVDAVMATICPVGLMTLVMTLVLRARFARTPPPGRYGGGWLGFVPRNVIARTILFVLVAAAVLVPLRVAVTLGLGMLPMTGRSHGLLNLCHGAVIGALFMPVIFVAALADRRATTFGSSR